MEKIKVDKDQYEFMIFQDSGFHVREEIDHISKIAIIVDSKKNDLSWADEPPFTDYESYIQWLNGDSYIVKFPLYLYDHSGWNFSITKTNCSWDTIHLGWIYVPKAGNESLSKEEAVEIILQEVKDLNTYYAEGFLGFGLVHKTTGEIAYSEGFLLGIENIKLRAREIFDPELHTLLENPKFV